MSVLTTAPMNVSCPSCASSFPVDPDRVPEGGILAVCSTCHRAFPVTRPAGWVTEPVVAEIAHPEIGQLAEPEIAETADPGMVQATEPEVAETADHEIQPAAEVEVASDVGAESVGEEHPEAAPEPASETASETGDETGPERVPAPEPPLAGDLGVSTALPEPIAEPMAEPIIEPMVEPVAEPGGFSGSPPPLVTPPPVSSSPPPSPSAPPPPPPPATLAPPAEEAQPATSARARFGLRDPENRAKRLARVLASDMITYNPARYADARRQGTLRQDFREEIEKSWEEYVEQVGEVLATTTHHFADALNEVLAQGEHLFDGPGFPS